jgi:RHS repeat-associated protein
MPATRIQMTMPDGEIVSYSYDTANRLSAIDSFLGAFAFTYDDLGRRTSLSYPNGAVTTYSYDNLSRLTEILSKNAKDRIINTFTYTHDAVGNRLSKTITEGKKHRQQKRYEYTYDDVYQLVESLPVKVKRHKEKELNRKAEVFEYDPVGNRLSGPHWKDSYTHNQANQMLTSRKYDYLYDANGNLSQKTETYGNSQDTWTYEYDYENRLVKVTKVEEDEIKTISFKYDPFGRRIEKRVEEIEEDEVEIKTFTYVYDNEDIVLEIKREFEEEDDDEDRKPRWKRWRHNNKTKTSKFVHGPGIDEPLAIEQKGRTYFYHADGLGSITALTDSRGHVVQSYEYSSFGEMKHHGGHVKQPYTYTSREWDKETGLYFYRARYYSPIEGSFISKDPIGYVGGDVNLLRYVLNNPVTLIDPIGLHSFSSSIKGNHCVTSCHASEKGEVGSMELTEGQSRALAKIFGGAGVAAIGAITENPKAMGLGIAITSEGIALSIAEFAFNGDTSDYKSLPSVLDMLFGLKKDEDECDR